MVQVTCLKLQMKTSKLYQTFGSRVHYMLNINFPGADLFKDDGTYSRYFTKLQRGKYSLKVSVENQHGVQISLHKSSGALYVPGYIVDGNYCIL